MKKIIQNLVAVRFKMFALLFILLFGRLSGFAQTKLADEVRIWGIETELVQPFLPNVGIVRFQTSYLLTEPSSSRGELLMGMYIRPNVKHDIVEKINEYLLIAGYRQYLLGGLHLEGKTNIGYAWGTKNKIDGLDYHNFSWFWEANAGYKLDFAKGQGSNLYVIGQFGVLSSISANIGPRGGKADTFLQGNLMVGINF
jgi:outer membrane receptor protein involved in Fe transport